MTSTDVQTALWLTISLLEDLRLPYAVMGALTLGFYGEGRATRDVDLLIDADQAALESVRTAASQRAILEDKLWLQHNPGIRETHVRLMVGAVPVDVMRPRDAQDRSACSRRRQHTAGGRSVWVVSPEDFILQKLKAGRPHDFDDAIPFFTNLRDQLDHAYLNEWALRLGVREELDYLWSQSERTPGPP